MSAFPPQTNFSSDPTNLPPSKPQSQSQGLHNGPYGGSQYGYNTGQGFSEERTRPGKQSQALKIRLWYMVIHLLLAIATCLTVSIIISWWPLIVISAAGAASAAFYVGLAGWQSIKGHKHRFVDRVDGEIMYFISQIFIWALLGGWSIWLNGGGECGWRLLRRAGLSLDSQTAVCNGLQATIGLSFAHAGFLLGYTVWFVMLIRRTGTDDKGRKWRASTSKLLREWH